MKKEISPGLAAAVVILVVVVALVALIIFTNPRGRNLKVQPSTEQTAPPKASGPSGGTATPGGGGGQ